MNEEAILCLVICICTFKAARSAHHINKQGEISFLNLYQSAEGKVFSKLGSLLSNQTTGSIEECWINCVQNKECLSVNTVALDKSRYQCELLNWAGTGFEGHLVSKANSSFLQSYTACVSNPCRNSGKCIAKEGGSNFTCDCAVPKGKPLFTGRRCDKPFNCVLFDFESGRLDGWTLSGEAFNSQPTYGDNYNARSNGLSNIQGDWYVSTYENRPSPSHKAGQAQGDKPIGTATSPKFVIRGTKLRFLIGGSSNCDHLRLELLIGGTAVRKACGRNVWTMAIKEFDVSAYQGKTAHVRLIDDSDSSWGFIIVDQIEDSYCSE